MTNETLSKVTIANKDNNDNINEIIDKSKNSTDNDNSDFMYEQISTDTDNQYVAFTVGGEEYGIKILAVQEIVSLPEITYIPNTPPFLRGVINLRGTIIPLIDLRVKFNLKVGELTKNSVIIVVNIGKDESSQKTVGMIVDVVSDVLSLTVEDTQNLPELSSNINTEYIDRIGKLKNRLVIILNLQKLLTLDEMAQIEKTAK